MLYSLFALSSVLFSVTAFLLLRNLANAERQIRQALLPSTNHAYIRALNHTLSEFVNESLLPVCGRDGLRNLELRHRDHHDPYRTIGELLERVSGLVQAEGSQQVETLVKATYQIGYTFNLSPNRFQSCLAVLVEMLKTRPSEHPIASVRTISPGDLVDARTMIVVGYGPRVLYPLGVIAYDATGNIVTRAQVICS